MKTPAMFFFLLASTLSLSAFAKTDVSHIVLGDRTVDALADSPNGEGPHPLLVIAPDVPEDKAFGEDLVKAANTAGFVTIRLRWAFGNAKAGEGKPSTDLAREAEELSVVLEQLSSARMMKKYEIDGTKIALVSSGFGAKVAMIKSSGVSGEKVKAHFMLAPSCVEKTPFKQTYGPFLSMKGPRLLALPNGGSCAVASVYECAKDAGDLLSLYTFTGTAQSAPALLPVATAWLKALNWVDPNAAARPHHDH